MDKVNIENISIDFYDQVLHVNPEGPSGDVTTNVDVDLNVVCFKKNEEEDFFVQILKSEITIVLTDSEANLEDSVNPEERARAYFTVHTTSLIHDESNKVDAFRKLLVSNARNGYNAAKMKLNSMASESVMKSFIISDMSDNDFEEIADSINLDKNIL